MYARAVRFTDVPQESVDAVVARVESEEGPPPGVEATSMKLLYDADQRTSIFIAFFETAEAMRKADEVLGAMDAGDTPGSRASVDMTEVAIERDA